MGLGVWVEAAERAAVPARELVRVARGGIGEVLDGALAEEEAEHARDVPAAHGVARLLARVEDARDKLLGVLVELLVLARGRGTKGEVAKVEARARMRAGVGVRVVVWEVVARVSWFVEMEEERRGGGAVGWRGQGGEGRGTYRLRS